MRRTLFYILLMILWTLCLAVGDGRADVVVSEARIHTAVTDYVRQMLTDFPGELAISVRRIGDLQVAGTGAVDLLVRPSSGRSHARSVPVVLELRRGPVVVREYPVIADVRYFDQVLVAARPIRRSEALTEAVVMAERREVTTMLGRYLSDPVEVQGMQAKMRIGVGRPVQARFVERIPVVNRGDRVRIRAQIGGITAVTVGIAREGGAAGDQIVVQNASSREKLLAEVVAPGLVRVLF